MRTSRICLILISTLVVQISSETTETTLSKLTDKIMRSTINIAAKPIGNLVHEVQDSNPEITQYLKDFTRKVKRTLEQTQQNGRVEEKFAFGKEFGSSKCIHKQCLDCNKSAIINLLVSSIYEYLHTYRFRLLVVPDVQIERLNYRK
ncbi:uncharacterized protein LOC112598630 isoform X2 [Melanaphis sacchari]|uniref:uncharacterized protein LOC112598630 isoform X2 n=1 Tax=Melanaphis sacchari TaxID=742174 RepID=UPI000DC1300E|nr:uncharacterized protein LOC112598630 isoform X2 [Melanaphis sacchari]